MYQVYPNIHMYIYIHIIPSMICIYIYYHYTVYRIPTMPSHFKVISKITYGYTLIMIFLFIPIDLFSTDHIYWIIIYGFIIGYTSIHTNIHYIHPMGQWMWDIYLIPIYSLYIPALLGIIPIYSHSYVSHIYINTCHGKTTIIIINRMY